MKSKQNVTAVVASKRPLQGHKVTETWSALAIKGCVDDEREIEMAQNMERVGEHVSALLSMARDIGTEVEIQNEQIETIAEKVRYSVFTTASNLVSIPNQFSIHNF